MARIRPHLFDEEEPDEALINLTPLIDVVFVVLISFIIIAPILKIDRVELASGSNQPNNYQESPPLSITVKNDNTIWVDGRQISLSDLSSWLAQKKKQTPGATPKLLQDRHSEFGTYQAIKNCIEACGFEELDVVLKSR